MMDHWLLNTAIEFGVPLTRVFPDVSQALTVAGSTAEVVSRLVAGNLLVPQTTVGSAGLDVGVTVVLNWHARYDANHKSHAIAFNRN